MPNSCSYRIWNKGRVHKIWVGLLALIDGLRANAAWADWGENWGEMTWVAAGIPVPILGNWGLLLLLAGLIAVAVLLLSKRRESRLILLMLVALAIPLTVYAATIAVPNVFVNGTVADANEVNENFVAVKAAVDDNDSRVTTSQGTADAAASSAAAAQSTADAAASVAAAAQVRVSGSCEVGSSIRVIAADGMVTCEADDDTDTTYSAGSGLSLAASSFSADTAVMQARVSGSCAVGKAISAIAIDGTVTCVDADTSPIVGTWASSTGTSTSASASLSWNTEKINTSTTHFGYVSGRDYIEIKVAGYYMIAFSCLKTSVSAGETASMDVDRRDSSGTHIETLGRIYTTGAGSTYVGLSTTVAASFAAGERLVIRDPNSTNGVFPGAVYNFVTVYRLN